VAGQPLCRVVSASDEGAGSCIGFGASRSLQWAPAAFYHSVVALAHNTGTALEKPDEQAAANRPWVSLPTAGFSAEDFARRGKASTWANSPEGEWTAFAERGAAAAARMQLAGGRSCSFVGVSVYRPSPRELALRLNFGKCHFPEGATTAAVDTAPRNLAIVVPVSATDTSDNAAGMMEWMCALMPHSACWHSGALKETLGRRLSEEAESLPSGFSSLGLGACHQRNSLLPKMYADATTLAKCAQRCVSMTGSLCTGISFSAKAPHCFAYTDSTLFGSYGHRGDSNAWECYKYGLSRVASSAKPTQVRATSETATATRTPPTTTAPMLDLFSTLGAAGMPALRKRVSPLESRCRAQGAVDWITLEDSSGLYLNASMWQLLSDHLPVVSSTGASGPATHGATVASDWVCVDLSGGCPRSPVSGGWEWWRYLLVALISADVVAAVLVPLLFYLSLPTRAEKEKRLKERQAYAAAYKEYEGRLQDWESIRDSIMEEREARQRWREQGDEEDDLFPFLTNPPAYCVTSTWLSPAAWMAALFGSRQDRGIDPFFDQDRGWSGDTQVYAPVDESVARSFLAALRAEYVQGVQGSVGKFCADAHLPTADLERLYPFEEEVRGAPSPEEAINAIASRWNLGFEADEGASGSFVGGLWADATSAGGTLLPEGGFTSSSFSTWFTAEQDASKAAGGPAAP